MKPQPGIADELASIRAKVVAILAERHATCVAPKAEAEVIAEARAELAAWRADFTATLNLAGRYDAPPGVRQVRIMDPFEGASPFVYDLWKDPEGVERRYVETIRNENRERQPGLPAVQRAARVQALANELLVTLRKEEVLIRAAEDAGLTIERRADAPPAIVVAIDLERVTVADLELDELS